MSRDLSEFVGGDTSPQACRDRTLALQAILDEDKHLELPVGPIYLTEGEVRWRGLVLKGPRFIRGLGPLSLLHFLPLDRDPEAPYRLLRGITVPEMFDPFEGVTLRDFCIEMHNPRAKKEQGHAIALFHVGRIRIQDIDVLGAPDGDAVYCGTNTSVVWIRDVLGRDAARCTVTLEGGSEGMDRVGLHVRGVTQQFTENSDPTQRLGRVVDCETSSKTGHALRGVTVTGCYGPGGLELGNVKGASVIGNIVERIHVGRVQRGTFVGNVVRALRQKAGFTAQRMFSGLVASNWFERPPVPNDLRFESDELRWASWYYATVLSRNYDVPLPPRDLVDEAKTTGELWAVYALTGSPMPSERAWDAVFGPAAIQAEHFAGDPADLKAFGTDALFGVNRTVYGEVKLHPEDGVNEGQDDRQGTVPDEERA